jgi:hypothetical protein
VLAQIDSLERKALRPMRCGETERVAAIEAEIADLRVKLKDIS